MAAERERRRHVRLSALARALVVMLGASWVAGCWLSHELAPSGDAGRPLDAGARRDSGAARDAAMAVGVRCGTETCTHNHACARRLDEPSARCVPFSMLPPPPPEGLGMFFPEWSEVRFCDDEADCPEDDSRCFFWLGETQIFACASVGDLCEPSAPSLVCLDDRSCPSCRPTCRPTAIAPLAACGF